VPGVQASLREVSAPNLVSLPRLRTSPVRVAPGSKTFDRALRGSRRQARGSIVDHLRRAARKGITLGDLAGEAGIGRRDAGALVEILVKLEAEGLAELSPAARKGSVRGIVRLPARTKRR